METSPVIPTEVRPPPLHPPSCRPEPFVPPGMLVLPGYPEQHARKCQALISKTETPANQVRRNSERFSELVQCPCPYFPETKIVGVFVEKGQRYLKLEFDPQLKSFQIHACPCQTPTLESDLLPKYASPHPGTGKEVLFCFNKLHHQLQQFQFGETIDEYVQVHYPELEYDPTRDIDESDVYNPRVGIVAKKGPFLQTWKKQQYKFAQMANVPVKMLETSVVMFNFNYEVNPVDSEDKNILDFINTLPPLKAHYCPCREVMGVAVKDPCTGKYLIFAYREGRFNPVPECENCNDSVTLDCLIPSYAEYSEELNAYLVHAFNTKTLVLEQYVFNSRDSEFKQVYVPTLTHDESRRSNTENFFFHPSPGITVYNTAGQGLGVAKICEETKTSQSVVVPVNTLVMQKEKRDQERQRRREAEAEEAARNVQFHEQLVQKQSVVMEHVENTIPDEVLEGILERRRAARVAAQLAAAAPQTQAQPSNNDMLSVPPASTGLPEVPSNGQPIAASSSKGVRKNSPLMKPGTVADVVDLTVSDDEHGNGNADTQLVEAAGKTPASMAPADQEINHGPDRGNAGLESPAGESEAAEDTATTPEASAPSPSAPEVPAGIPAVEEAAKAAIATPIAPKDSALAQTDPETPADSTEAAGKTPASMAPTDQEINHGPDRGNAGLESPAGDLKASKTSEESALPPPAPEVPAADPVIPEAPEAPIAAPVSPEDNEQVSMEPEDQEIHHKLYRENSGRESPAGEPEAVEKTATTLKASALPPPVSEVAAATPIVPEALEAATATPVAPEDNEQASMARKDQEIHQELDREDAGRKLPAGEPEAAEKTATTLETSAPPPSTPEVPAAKPVVPEALEALIATTVAPEDNEQVIMEPEDQEIHHERDQENSGREAPAGNPEAAEGTATTPETSALPPPVTEGPAATSVVPEAAEALTATPVVPEALALAQTDPETPEDSNAPPPVFEAPIATSTGTVAPTIPLITPKIEIPDVVVEPVDGQQVDPSAEEQFIHTENHQTASASTTETTEDRQQDPAAPVTQKSPEAPPSDTLITITEEIEQDPEAEQESAVNTGHNTEDQRIDPESVAQTTEENQQEAPLAPDAQNSLESRLPTTTKAVFQDSPEAPEPSATFSTANPSYSPGPSSTLAKKEKKKPSKAQKITEPPSTNDGGQSSAAPKKKKPTKRSQEMTASEDPANLSVAPEFEPLGSGQEEGAAPPAPKKNRGQKSAANRPAEEVASSGGSKAPKKTQSRSTTTTGAKRRRGREVTPDEQLLDDLWENPEISSSEFDPPDASQDGAGSSQAVDAQLSSRKDTAAPPVPKKTRRKTTRLSPSPQPAKTRKRPPPSAQRKSENEASSQDDPPKKSRSRSTKKAKASDPAAEDSQVNANPSELPSTQEVPASDMREENPEVIPPSAISGAESSGETLVGNDGSLSDTSSDFEPQPQSSVASSSTPAKQKRPRSKPAKDSSTDASLPTEKGTSRKPSSGKDNRQRDPKKRAPPKESKTRKTCTTDAGAPQVLNHVGIPALEPARSESTSPPPLIDPTAQEFDSSDGIAPPLPIQQAQRQDSRSDESTPMNQETITFRPLASQSPEHLVNPSSADASNPGSPQHDLNHHEMLEHASDAELETHRTYDQVFPIIQTFPNGVQSSNSSSGCPQSQSSGMQLNVDQQHGLQENFGHHLHQQFDPAFFPQPGIQPQEMTNVFSNQVYQMVENIVDEMGNGSHLNGIPPNGYADGNYNQHQLEDPHSGYTQYGQGQSPRGSGSSGSIQTSPVNSPGPSGPPGAPRSPGSGTPAPIDVRYLQTHGINPIDVMALNDALLSSSSEIGSESGQNSDDPLSTTTDAVIHGTSSTQKRRQQCYSTFGRRKKKRSAKPKIVDPNKPPAEKRQRKKFEPSTKPNEHKMSTRAKTDEEKRLAEDSQQNQEILTASEMAYGGEESRGDSTLAAQGPDFPQEAPEVPQGEPSRESEVPAAPQGDASKEASAIPADAPQDPDVQKEEEVLEEDSSSSSPAPETEASGTTSEGPSLTKMTASGTGSLSSTSAPVAPRDAAAFRDPSLAHGDESGERSLSSTPTPEALPVPVSPQLAAPEHTSSSISSGNPSLVRNSPSPSNTDGSFDEYGMNFGNSELSGNPSSPSTEVNGPPSSSSNIGLLAPQRSIGEQSSYGPTGTSPSSPATSGITAAAEMSTAAAAHVPGPQPQMRQSHGPGSPSSRIDSLRLSNLNYWGKEK